MRGILKRASVVCFPESEPQERIALDTEQGLPPHTRLLRGSPGSGGRSSITTSTDLNTDVTRKVRAGPAQDVTQTSSEDHICGDVAMRGDGADTRRRIKTKREPREVRGGQSSSAEQHVPRRIFWKTVPQERAVAVTTQEALDGSREKSMRIANVENNALNWVSISSA